MGETTCDGCGDLVDEETVSFCNDCHLWLCKGCWGNSGFPYLCGQCDKYDDEEDDDGMEGEEREDDQEPTGDE